MSCRLCQELFPGSCLCLLSSSTAMCPGPWPVLILLQLATTKALTRYPSLFSIVKIILCVPCLLSLIHIYLEKYKAVQTKKQKNNKLEFFFSCTPLIPNSFADASFWEADLKTWSWQPQADHHLRHLVQGLLQSAWGAKERKRKRYKKGVL